MTRKTTQWEDEQALFSTKHPNLEPTGATLSHTSLNPMQSGSRLLNQLVLAVSLLDFTPRRATPY